MSLPRFITWLPVPAAGLAVAVLGNMPGETPPVRGLQTPGGAGERADAEAGARSGKRGEPRVAVTEADAVRFLEMKRKAMGTEDQAAATARWQAFLERWAATQPREAAEFLEKQGLLEFMALDALPVLRAWARCDGASLPVWVEAGGDERQRWWAGACDVFAQAWVEHDPNAAWAWVNAGGSDGLESTIVGLRFQSAAAGEIAAWLAQHGAADPKISAAARDTAVRLLAGHHLKEDTADAALAWLDTLARPDEKGTAAQAILTNLTQQAPEKSVAWLARQPAAVASPDMTWKAKEAMAGWTRGDAAAAGAWLNGHRDSPAAPAFIEAYAMGIAGDDPAAARQWIAQLPERPALERPANGGFYMEIHPPATRAELEGLVSLAEISAIAMDDPARGIALAGELPGDAAAALGNYTFQLVRETPDGPPLPRFTARNPYVCPPIHMSRLPLPTQIMTRNADGTLAPEPPSAKTEALAQALHAARAATAAAAAAGGPAGSAR